MNENIHNKQQSETMREDSFMKKVLKKRLNQKGLTLIELLAVIVILAIVAAIAIPAIGSIIENSRIKGVKSDAILVLNAAQLQLLEDEGAFATGSPSTVSSTYLENAGVFSGISYDVEIIGDKLTIDGSVQAGNKTIVFNQASIEDINPDDADSDPVASGTVQNSKVFVP